MNLKEKQDAYRQDLKEKRDTAAAELEEKRKQYKIELELKRQGAAAMIDIELLNKTIAEIQANMKDLESARITCVFSKPR